jgi:hypothetical protein
VADAGEAVPMTTAMTAAMPAVIWVSFRKAGILVRLRGT